MSFSLSKCLEIAGQTYREHVLRRGFLFFAFGVPLLFPLLVILIAFWLALSTPLTMVLGYVDETGLVGGGEEAGEPSAVPGIQIQAFPDKAAAQSAFERGEIIGYYVLTSDYMATGHVQQVVRWDRTLIARPTFENFIRTRLFHQTPDAERRRILRGTIIAYNALAPQPNSNLERAGGLLILLVVLVLYLVLLQFTHSYLWRALNAEHENRTIEILLTSVSVQELVGGKTLGILAVGLTPLAIWGAVLGVVGWLALPFLGVLVPDLARASLWGLIGLSLVILIPGWFLEATFTLLLGGITGVLESGQTLPWLVGIVQVVVLLPMALTALVAPDSTAAVVLSLFPPTAPLVLPLRLGMTTVPAWQTVLAILFLWASVVLMLGASARLYRLARWGGTHTWRSRLRRAFFF